MFFLSLFTVYLSLLSFYVKLEQLKRQQMAKMNDGVPKERLGTSRLRWADKLKNDDVQEKCNF